MASAARCSSPLSSASSSIVCIRLRITRGSQPSNDSVVWTRVPSPWGSNDQTWTALTPIVVPVQPSSSGRSTLSSLDVILDPVFQRNTEPAATGPSSSSDLTSGFQSGQRSKSASTSQTTSGGAAISASLVAMTGASRGTSMAADSIAGGRGAGLRAAFGNAFAVLLVAAFLAAVFFLPEPWGYVAVAVAAFVEVAEVYFWIRFLRRYRVTTGAEGLVGERAEVVEALAPTGRVRLRGELWTARAAEPAIAGQRVRVTAVDGLTLEVEAD